MTHPAPSSMLSPASLWLSSRPRLAVGAAVLTVAFWQTWLSFPPTWLAFREHGFVVAIFCAWLVWRDRERLAGDGRGWPLANVAVLGLSMLWLVGFVLNTQLVYQAALPLVFLAWLLATAGWSAWRTALPIAGAFYFAVPVWSMATRPLQSMTVLANGGLLSLVGIDAKIEGDFISIPEGRFVVADGCAGVGYLEIGLMVSVMYALLFLKTWRGRIAAMLMAAALTIVSNWIRVFGLIVIGHRTHMRSSLMQGHGTYGWIIFSIAMVLFVLLVPLIDAFDRHLASKSPREQDPPSPGDTARPDIPARRLSFSTGLAVVGPVLLMTTVILPPVAAPPERAPGISPASDWAQLGATTTSLVASDATTTGQAADGPTAGAAGLVDWMPEYLGADEHRRERWAHGKDTVQVDRMVYFTQSQGKELVNSENHIAPDSLVSGQSLTSSLDAAGRTVSTSIVRTAAGPLLVWYWYHVAGRDTPSETRAKLLELLAVAQRTPPSELLTVSTRCDDAECTRAQETLRAFVTGRSASE